MPRVISGSAKGRRLKGVPGDSTRPILDRVKENLFNILGKSVVGSTWLDLFAGTGQVGIEALSRGADYCLFTELDRKAIATINENLEIAKVTDRAEVRRTDAFKYLETGLIKEPFEFIFIAPPQYKEMWVKTIRIIDKRPEVLAPDGAVIVQIDPRESEDLELENLEIFDERKYGKTLLIFYTWPGE